MGELNLVRTDDPLYKRYSWWPMLLGPLAVGIVAFSRWRGWDIDQLDVTLETLAPWLIAVATAIYWSRAIATRNPLAIVLTGLTASLLCREIHFDGMSRAIFVLLGFVGVWFVAWRDILAGPLRDRRQTSWLIATLATYFLSQLIAKRVFKFVPGEIPIHSKLEEAVETVAHLMMIITSLVGSWKVYRSPVGPLVCSAGETDAADTPGR